MNKNNWIIYGLLTVFGLFSIFMIVSVVYTILNGGPC